MGCSPSKGNNFGTLGPVRKSRMLPPALQESPRQSPFEDGENRNSTASTDGDTKERKTAGQSQVIQKEAHMTPQKKRSVTELAPQAVNTDKFGSQAVDNNTVSQKKEKNYDKQDITEKKSGRKPKKNTRGAKVLKKKEKDKLTSEHKVDFPEPLVKAHQAAYAFLNPSINKYDVLLGLLEQATQTQVSVQPMVAFMALRYEEIIQGLEEMADEGEKVFKENGEHLAWPSQMKNLSSSTLKSGSANIEPPPDLLQQLLQYTTQRMRNVSRTVGGIGDSALEEAVEFFASVSELLEEKLKVKRAVETRLMQLLSRIEMASLRKPGPEDSALFSEDSGIGAESESLAGSERHYRRESCESTATNRTTPVSPIGYTSMNTRQGVSRQKLLSQISPSVSLTSLNSLGSTCTIMANEQRDSLLGSVSLDDGEEDDNDDNKEIDRGMGDVQVRFRKQSNSSPVDREQQHPCRLPPKRIENPQNVEMTLKMKNAISGRIQFVPSQNPSAKTKVAGSPKNSRRQWMDEEERSPKRPQTAAPVRKAVVKKSPVGREQRSRSAESLRSKGEDPTLLELERTQKDLNQRLQRMSKSMAGVNTRTAPSKQNQGSSPAQSPAINRKHPPLEKNSNPQPLKDKADITKHNNKKQEVTTDFEDDKQKNKKTPKGPVKATPPPSPPSSPLPSSGFRRGRNSVKKLIDTFSQGIEELDSPTVLGPLKGVRKCGVPVLPGLGNVEAVLSAGITSCRPESNSSEKTGDLDLDSLPPPPPEVLMDNSFEGAQSLSSGVADDGTTKVGKSPVLKRTVVSQRLRASVHSVTVLPSKGGLRQASKVISLARADQQETSALSKVSQPDAQLEADPGKEKDSLYQQARKIIHLRHSSDSQTEKSSTSYLEANPPTSQEESADFQDGGNSSVPGTNTTVSILLPSAAVTSQPPATPPKSRGRMLPSTPSTPSSLQRRLPSPHNFKRQPTPPSSASPPVNRKLPTPPAVQRRLTSSPVAKQNILNSNSASSYPFKAPSPPASPKVQRWSRENSSEDSSSARMVNNARSVFCPASPSLFEAQPCSVPRPPQAWTSTGVSSFSRPLGTHARFPVSFQGPRPFIRRSHSDRRPSLSLPPRSPGISVAETCGSEPAIFSQGLEDEPTRDDELWGSQSDLRATPRSASHPDLCVVGQALHRD
ncbi:photoreceptor cilium actin regulator [Xiphias gladius]|uniref:photoreceptor cilium actin regulator n=1 Tax=Xiphias gladius TaxID=8245 RepID=UPI001A98CEB6|nr:photoreceptor cilium actin regulator [Xiphias gladius]XP_039993149.1 photoreceptor cilium actin regulator [Xiphias gladius]XP_039993150.1 photoreceptor cilium actin regulator [Xiphias gladius]